MGDKTLGHHPSINTHILNMNRLIMCVCILPFYNARNDTQPFHSGFSTGDWKNTNRKMKNGRGVGMGDRKGGEGELMGDCSLERGTG